MIWCNVSGCSSVTSCPVCDDCRCAGFLIHLHAHEFPIEFRICERPSGKHDVGLLSSGTVYQFLTFESQGCFDSMREQRQTRVETSYSPGLLDFLSCVKKYQSRQLERG